MTTYELEPEVPGGLGADSVLDTSVHPPIVHHLAFEFDDWLGDDLISSFPVYLVTDRLRDALIAEGLTGITFADATVSTSEMFDDIAGDLELPHWSWLQVNGTAGVDDAWRGGRHRLTVSQRFFDVAARFTLERCGVVTDPA